MFGFVSFSELATMIRKGAGRIPSGVEWVVGIPRSGMIPAYMLGLYRNLPVTTVNAFLSGAETEKGERQLGKPQVAPLDSHCILLVDDSLSSGKAMKQAINQIRNAGYKGRIVTCVIIVEPSCTGDVDIYFCKMLQPRIFEWNAFHHRIVEKACFDLDGVLCVDPTEDQNDDGPLYREFLKNATLLNKPSKTIGHIVSARLEKYRDLTEAWLLRNEINYRELHLIDLPSAEERKRLMVHAAHKAYVYRNSDACIFFESDKSQAADIARLSSKPVLCTEDMIMHYPSLTAWPLKQIVRWKFTGPLVKARSIMQKIKTKTRFGG